jgi:hypothetical protein
MGLVAAGVVAFKAWQAASDPSVQIAFPQVPGFGEIGWLGIPWAAWLAIPVMVFLLVYMVRRPLAKAGAADEPAPPTAVM